MERITYRQEDGRVRFTIAGDRIYCSTQATADIIAWYEELLERMGYVFDDNTEEVHKTIEIYNSVM